MESRKLNPSFTFIVWDSYSDIWRHSQPIWFAENCCLIGSIYCQKSFVVFHLFVLWSPTLPNYSFFQSRLHLWKITESTTGVMRILSLKMFRFHNHHLFLDIFHQLFKSHGGGKQPKQSKASNFLSLKKTNTEIQNWN